MKKEGYKSFLDLIFLLVVFCAAWYFKPYLPIALQGAFVIISTSLVAVIIIKIRKISLKALGLQRISIKGNFFREIITVSVLIFIVQILGISIIGSLFGSPNAGAAIDNQPLTTTGFLLDIIFNVWLITAIGEEFIFRGIIINRLRALFNNINNGYTIYLIAGLQAIWFGMAHPSQGLSGILITGLIGFALGIYLLKFSKHGLWPLIIAHCLIDTIVLTITFVN